MISHVLSQHECIIVLFIFRTIGRRNVALMQVLCQLSYHTAILRQLRFAK